MKKTANATIETWHLEAENGRQPTSARRSRCSRAGRGSYITGVDPQERNSLRRSHGDMCRSRIEPSTPISAVSCRGAASLSAAPPDLPARTWPGSGGGRGLRLRLAREQGRDAFRDAEERRRD